METAKNLVFDILHSLHSFGFQEIYGINAHGDIEQNVLFMDSFRSAYAQIGIRARYCFRKEVMHLYGLDGHEDFICPVEPAGISVSAASESDVHAGDIETAVMVRYFGRCADTAVAETMPPVTLEPGKEMEWLLGGKTKELSANGYVGNPARYAEVRIDAYMDDISQRYATAIIDKRRA
jgi:creatinine amidohydrolase